MLSDILKQIEISENPVALMRKLVLDAGGFWSDHDGREHATLFEIQVCGVTGYGVGPDAAVTNWIEAASRHIENETVDTVSEVR